MTTAKSELTQPEPQIEQLRKQIAEVETALQLPQANLSAGVAATFAGESLGLYEQIQAKLAAADTKAAVGWILYSKPELLTWQ